LYTDFFGSKTFYLSHQILSKIRNDWNNSVGCTKINVTLQRSSFFKIHTQIFSVPKLFISHIKYYLKFETIGIIAWGAQK
jgi:hypothetical protein